MKSHYRTAVVETSGEPLAVATGLATSGLFDTYVVYEGPDGWSYAGGAAAEIVLGPRTVRCTENGTTRERPWRGDPLEPVREFLDGLDIEDWRAYGWSAFELAYAIAGAEAGEQVLLHLTVPETEVTLNGSRAVLRSMSSDALASVEAVMSRMDPEPRIPARTAHARLESGGPAYCEGVEAGVRDIRDGRFQKVVLSRVVPVEGEIDFAATYMAGRRANTPARSFLMSMAGMRALGFSPETVVEISAGGRVTSQPLAGTRALTGDPATDAQLREELLADPKELHEHAISVKVAVDELGGPCKPETVVVEEYMTVKCRGTVQHLASRVAGQLPEGGSPWDAFAAVFPAVTASGVPKRPSYEAIRGYESQPRGPYAGTVMTVGQDGSMDAALVLRSLFSRGGETWLRAGAGVVGNSRPARELEETVEKLSSVSRHLVPRGSSGPPGGPPAGQVTVPKQRRPRRAGAQEQS
ncbi:salicylate synthase [Streptomyces ovatisporus]|uniref:Salicylate synthase n=1 Tax=Streptomyces ovatisporus TaxID=1128682 RepID=A0ABV9A8K4_9ACTN